MKALLHVLLCGAVLSFCAMAQRGGGGHGGGGFGGGGGMHGGGMGMGGGGMHGGGIGMGGGMHGGGIGMGGGGMRGGIAGGGFRGGIGGGFRGGIGFNRGFGFRGFGFRGSWPWWGWGGGWGWPSYWPYYSAAYAYPYYSDYSSYYPDYSGYSDPSYGTQPYPAQGYGPPQGYGGQPSVNVIYPPAQTTVVVTPNSAAQYDQYGQPVNAQYGQPANAGGYSSPSYNSNQTVYLIATKDHTIQAALSYSISGSTLEYTTLDHQQKRVPLDQVDRPLTERLNRERHVSFQMGP